MIVGSKQFYSLYMPPTGSSASWRQCHLHHNSWGVMSAVCNCCSTNSRLRTPRCTFVEVGRNSRFMDSVVISASCSADHYNIISDSLITSAQIAFVFLNQCCKSSSLPENSFGRPTSTLHDSHPLHKFHSCKPNTAC